MTSTLTRYELDTIAMKARYVVVDELDVLTGWSIAGAGATQALDLVNFRSGFNGYKMTVPASIAGVSTKAFPPIDLQGVSVSDHIRFWVYIDVSSRVSAATIQFIDNQGSPVTATYTLTGLADGWQRFSVAKSAFTNGGTVRWSTIATVKFNVTATAGGTVNVTWDMLRVMLGPTIGYTNGAWNESGASADVVDNILKFFSGGTWSFTLPLSNAALYRLIGDATVTIDTVADTIVLGGNGKSLSLLEVFSPGFDSIAQLIKYQPYYYQNSVIMGKIRTAQGQELSRFLATLIDMFNQTYYSRATYRLDEHERAAGVGEGTGSYSVVVRRGRIATRYAFAWLKANIDNMEKLVENFVTEVLVTEQPSTYSFTVQIISPKGTPANLAEIQAAIELYKPAHLGYTITFTATTWNVMDAYNRSWDTAQTYTWNAFEVS